MKSRRQRLKPQDVSINVGESITFQCKSLLMKSWKQTMWVLNGGPILGFAKILKDPNELVIEHAYPNNTGQYSCYGLKRKRNLKIVPFVSTTSLRVFGTLFNNISYSCF